MVIANLNQIDQNTVGGFCIMERQKKTYIILAFICMSLIILICVGVYYIYVVPKDFKMENIEDGTNLLVWRCDDALKEQPQMISADMYQGIRKTVSGEGRKGYTKIRAWAYLPDHSIESARSRILIKNSANGNYYELYTESESRPDITEAYGNETYNYDLSGLIAYCPNWFIKEGNEYHIYIYFRHEDSQYFINTQKVIK